MISFKKYLIAAVVLVSAFTLQAQEKINPVIKHYGGIIDAPFAVEKPDPNMEYKVLIDIATGDSDPKAVMYSLENVARLINLHAMGGVPMEHLKVICVIHGPAIASVMDNETYKTKYDVDNPHLPLFKELAAAGVQFFACSQSILGRNIDYSKLAPEVKVATSMLTVMTTYQLKGYAALKF